LITVFLTVGFTVSSQELSETESAEKLCALGLFKGTDNGFELEKSADRSQMLVMLLRLLGEENAALSFEEQNPFSDRCWADSCIAYGYKKGLVNGVGNGLFGSFDTASVRQYCTMLLRAIGYGQEENLYENAPEIASCVLLCDIPDGDGVLTRGNMAYLSYRALGSKLYGSDRTLASKLIEEGTVSEKDYAGTLEKYGSATVMIYMIASDLESERSMATKDISEMLAADSNEKLNVLVQSGGTKVWNNDFLSDGAVERFEVKDGKANVLGKVENAQMCDSQTLCDFLTWGKEYAPADRYILVFWDHGMGTVGGFGKDKVSERAPMRLYEIKEGIEKAGIWFSVIGFDACLMATAESAFALKDCAGLLVSSEDITSYEGWHYTTFLNALSRNLSVPDMALSKLISDSHIMFSKSLTSNISVINLDGAEVLYGQLEKMGNGFLSRLVLDEQALGSFDGGYDQFDLAFLLRKAPDAKYALYAAQNMVIYSKNSSQKHDCFGIAIYIPQKRLGEYAAVKEDLTRCGYKKEYFNLFTAEA